MFRACWLVLVVAATLLLAPASAQPQSPYRTGEQIVVELYTSQGCDTCRRANRLLGQLAASPDVIAITFPVDYWDYLGWRDTFASSDFTQRQRRYWRSLHARSLYTPEIVMNGAAHVNAASAERVTDLLATFRAAPVHQGPRVTIERSGAGARVFVGRGRPHNPPADVWIVPFDPGPVWETVRTGDNAGHRVVHYNLAQGLSRIGAWTGEPARYEHRYCRRQCAVIVQERNGGPVIAAARTPAS
ncbi:MAG: DUF1223 domain-containing protein [Hyphomonadaceae bacterium]|nr:DUF1223 domain-containing protein [Hyphomonadaceae bacterium]